MLDELEQQHTYNEHGERTFASMRVYPGLTLGAAWTKGIAEQHDAMGNVTSIARAAVPGATGSIVMTATYRNAGRPDARTVMTANAGQAYNGHAGHVPDTAISGLPEPPGGWLDMPGVSNQCCGGGLSSRIGQTIDIVTVDGAVP